jgi:hypothetical protein
MPRSTNGKGDTGRRRPAFPPSDAACRRPGKPNPANDLAGHTAYLHTGDNPGYQSLALWLPGQAVCAVILSNDEAADTEALLRQLIPAALHKDER